MRWRVKVVSVNVVLNGPLNQPCQFLFVRVGLLIAPANIRFRPVCVDSSSRDVVIGPLDIERVLEVIRVAGCLASLFSLLAVVLE
jgi:hypothetical protein